MSRPNPSGNNNAYAQDNEISWIDWEGIDTYGWDLFEFTKRLIEIRQRQPAFSPRPVFDRSIQ